MTRVLLAAAAALLCACSPVYVAKVTAGHVKLLWRRKRIDKALANPKTSPELKAKLEVVEAARAFAFDTMGLRRSAEYSTYSEVKGPYLTYLVCACEKLRFKPYLWHFLLVGVFPYEGHFSEADAKREAARLEKKGYDTTINGVAAYNTPLWISDPVPSTLLNEPPGELASVIIHELTHSTIMFKSQIDFDESLASFVGDQGAKDFLAARYGPDSPEMKDFEKSLKDDELFGREMDRLHDELEAVYDGPGTEADRLKRREELFAAGLKGLHDEGFQLKTLNNAVIVAHRVYHQDLSLFERAFQERGRNWPKTISFFRALDPRSPLDDLRRKAAAP